MNLYNYTFYKIYKSISRVNNYSPEISATIWLSILIGMNIMSTLLYLKFKLEQISLNSIYIALTIIYIFNFLFFIKNKKYIKIIKQFDSENNKTIFNYLILFYPFISFYLMFKTLKIDNTDTFIMLSILLIIEIYFHLNKKG